MNALSLPLGVAYFVSCAEAFSVPIEVGIKSGSYVFAYLSSSASPDLLIPLKKFSNTLGRFSGETATLSIDLRIGVAAPVLHLDRFFDKYKGFPCREEFKLLDNSVYTFRENTELGKILITSGNQMTVITQTFANKSHGPENSIIIMVSQSIDAIRESVKIPPNYVAWNWEFEDTFTYLDIGLNAARK